MSSNNWQWGNYVPQGSPDIDSSTTCSWAPAVFPIDPVTNSTHLVTDTGDSSWTVIEQYIYDGVTWTWKQVPISGNSSLTNLNLAGNRIATHNDNDPAGNNVNDINETITNFGTPVVDITTTPWEAIVTLPYNQEWGTVDNVVFNIVFPTPVSVVNDIDLKFDANWDLIVEIEYTDDNWVTQTTTDSTPITIPSNEDYVQYTGNNTVPTWTPPNWVDTRVLSNGDRYDWDWTNWILASSSCPAPMTRAALRSLRTAWNLKTECHYIITNPNAQGTLTAESIILHAVDANTLSMQAWIKTSHDTLAWNWTYDIDADDVLEITDNLDNHVKHNVSIINFPWGVASVYDNTVIGGRIVDGWAARISWNKVWISAVLTVNGGSSYNNTLEENAEALFISASSLSNTFEQDAIYRQVGTWYIRYSRVWTNSNVTNGNTNITNKEILDTQVNTTGSTWTISWGTFSWAVLNALQNITSLTLNNVTMWAGSSISATWALRLYCNGNTLTWTGRLLVTAWAQLDVNYGWCYSNSGYINVTLWKLTVNNSNCMNGYIQHSTAWTNIVSERTISDGYLRFLNTCTGNRVYYGAQSGYIDISGTSTNSFIYYSDSSSNGKLYIANSVNARFYYADVDSNATIRSSWNTGTHYLYYCKASSGWVVEMLNKNGWRIYSWTAMSTSILRFQWAWGWNLYYSTMTAYYYALISATAWTRSGLYGMWRRSFTITNPTTWAPYNTWAAWQNFS